MSPLLNFAAGLERVYDPFLFPVLGTKESIKKGKTIFVIQLAVCIYQKYIQCRFIYLFVLYSEIFDRFPETGMDPGCLSSYLVAYVAARRVTIISWTKHGADLQPFLFVTMRCIN